MNLTFSLQVQSKKAKNVKEKGNKDILQWKQFQASDHHDSLMKATNSNKNALCKT
jgi:hypothetical protein